MSLLDTYESDLQQSASVAATLPLDPIKPEPKHSAWTTVPRFVAGAVNELGGTALDVVGGVGQILTAGGNVQNKNFVKPQDDPNLFRDENAQAMYSYARDLRPDPETASVAEQMFFSLGKGITKAVGSIALLGPFAGATAFGTSEGMTTAEDLAEQGVDPETRAKVGGVTGALSGASVVIPVAGKTLAQTAGLALLGGPASFAAQQEASKKILENADYADLAAQYDPLDPVGLTVSALVPLAFGAYAMRGAAKAAKASKAKAEPTTSANTETSSSAHAAPTHDEIDAVMTHNLTLQRDIHETTPPDVAIEKMTAKSSEPYPWETQQPELTAQQKLANPETRSMLEGMKSETGWAEVGGKIIRDYNTQEVTGRTSWIPKYDWWPNRPDGLNEAKTAKAIDKLLAGDKLNTAEQRMANYLMDVVAERRASNDWMPKPDELVAHDLQPQDALETAMVARASALDDALVERLAIQHADDDAAFMAKIKEYLNENDQNAKTSGSSEGHQPAQEPASAAADHQTQEVKLPEGYDLTSHIAEAQRLLSEASTQGKTLDQLVADVGASPIVNNLLIGLHKFGNNQAGLADMLKRYHESALANNANKSPHELIADAIESAPQIAPSKDYASSVLNRVEEIQRTNPDMPVALDANGNRVSAADELEAIRRQVQEGTDDELGAMDADLVQVAADCFLSVGGVA